MQLRGPLVGPDRWWSHTLLKGTVRETLASYGSVPEEGPPLSFDQRVLEPTFPFSCSLALLFSINKFRLD